MSMTAVISDKEVTSFLQGEFKGYTRSKVGKRLKSVCGTQEGLRQVLLRDVSDAVRCYVHGLWKPCVVLCGGAMEGILTALLDSRPRGQVKDAWASVAKGQGPKSLKDYTLEERILVAKELGILGKGAASYGQGLRNYRNYVHPREELKTGHPLAASDARIALELVLKLLDEVGH